MIRLGPLPVRVGAEFQYYPVTPEVAGPQYNLSLTFTPIIPAPEWAKRLLFCKCDKERLLGEKKYATICSISLRGKQPQHRLKLHLAPEAISPRESSGIDRLAI